MGLAGLLSLLPLVALMRCSRRHLACLYALAAAVLTLAGCAATPPFPPTLTQQAQSVPSPEALSQNPRAPTTPIAWGGTIVRTVNEAHDTLITVLAYPLNGAMRPQLQGRPLGRFILRNPGFLDPLIYAPNRELTVIGRVNQFQHGKIGEQPYTFPVVAPQALHLWPVKPVPLSPRFQFGIGIGVGSRF